MKVENSSKCGHVLAKEQGMLFEHG